MAQSRSRPWPIILTLIGIMLLVVLWCVYWVIASRLLRDNFESERARLAAAGVAFDCKAAQWGGFPFRFERDCIAPSLTVEGERIEANNLLLVMQAYMPNRAVALIDGPVATASGLTVTHERGVASARFSGMHDWQATLEAPKVQAPPYGSADRLLVSARDQGQDRLDIAVDVTKAEALLGPGQLVRIDEASLLAAVPRKTLTRDFLAALARNGENISIDSIRLRKGELVVTAKGEIGLGTTGYIDGHLVTTSNRLDLLMAELRQVFSLTDKDAQTFTTMIGLLQPGKTTDVTLDLIAKDGKLYWGPIKLTELPPVL